MNLVHRATLGLPLLCAALLASQGGCGGGLTSAEGGLGGSGGAAAPMTGGTPGAVTGADAGSQADAAPPPFAATSEPTGVVDVALSPNAVYWSTGTEVMSKAFDGGPATPIAIAQSFAGALATDAERVYWINAGDGSIVSAPLGGGQPVTLASSQDTQAASKIAVDDANVYWSAGGTLTGDGGTTPGQIVSVPRGGGAPTVLVTGLQGAVAFAVGGGAVVYAPTVDSNSDVMTTINSIPRDGGAPTPLATTMQGVYSIAIDGTTVYWVDGSHHGVDEPYGDGRIRAVPLGGGAATVVVDNLYGPEQLVTSAGRLYWSTLSSEGSDALWSLPEPGGPAAGSAPATIASASARSLGRFAVDPTHVAWVVNKTDGEVFVAPR